VRRNGGGMWIESKTGRVLLYVYPRLNQNTDYKKPDEAEALDIVRAIAGFRSAGTGRGRIIGCPRPSGRGAGRGNNGP
jgi:hypothetical protein